MNPVRFGALVLRDGLSGLLRIRDDGGAMAFETGSYLRAAPFEATKTVKDI
jgi:hypothetical protein